VPAPTPTTTQSPTATNASDTGAITLSLQPQTSPGGSGKPPSTGRPPVAPGAPCNFTPDTQVSTDHGKEDIGNLHVGDKVLAYNPKTHKMEWQPILHVWKHTDHDLVNLTITMTTKGQHGKAATKTSEVVHTTSEHPFFTAEQGFVAAGNLKLGMHVLRADGSVGMITGWKVVPGMQVVHNTCGPKDYKELRDNLNNAGRTVQNGHNPHHIIPCALREHDLIQATNGRFDINAEYNGRPLWNRYHQAEALGDLEPYHDAHPHYNDYVETLLDSEYQRLDTSGTLTPDTAFDALMNIIGGMNAWIDTLGWFGALGGSACIITA